MSNRVTSALAALEPIAASMHGDGYMLSVREDTNGALTIDITATADACADCLVPRSVMVSIIESLLTDNGIAPAGLEVRYPEEELSDS